MGTPEFPNLGKHCSVDDCRQNDFLPFTCDCCRKVFCLDHRSYIRHQCPNANKNDVTVAICPLCAKGVRLIPGENPNITWESHVNIECDPSNYEKATKKPKCPVQGCREILTFSNSIKCRDCTSNHCLKHRFGPDHKCPGPKKPEPAFQISSFFNRSTGKEDSNQSKWSTSLFNAASSGFARLSSEINQAFSRDIAAAPNNGSSSGKIEACPLCNLRFSSGKSLVDHVQKIHQNRGVMKSTLDVCPNCSKGFRDAVTLVEHLEKEHGGVSKSVK